MGSNPSATMKDRTLPWLLLGLGIGMLGGWAARNSRPPTAGSSAEKTVVPRQSAPTSHGARRFPADWATAKASADLTTEALVAKIDPLQLTRARHDLLHVLENADSATLRRLLNELGDLADSDRTPKANVRRFVRDAVLEHWLKTDPEGVLAYATTRKPPLPESVLNRTLQQWATLDYGRLKTLRGETSGTVKAAVEGAILANCPDTSFASALQAVGDILAGTFSSSRGALGLEWSAPDKARARFFAKFARSDWPGLKAWLASAEGASFSKDPSLRGVLAGIRSNDDIQSWLAQTDLNPGAVRTVIRGQDDIDSRKPWIPPKPEPLMTADEFQRWVLDQPQERQARETEKWIGKWTTRNPRVAADWIRQHRSDDWRGSQLIDLAGQLAQQDGAAAVDFAHQFDEPERWQIVQTALMQWARRDFATAARIAEAEPAGPSRDNALKGLAEIVTEYPMEQALPWAAKLPADVRDTASRKIFTELARQQPAAAAAGLSDWLAAGYSVSREAAEAVATE